jgi:ketosteroid isomerase-like protein
MKVLILLVSLLCAAALGQGQTNDMAPIQSLVETERAFAKASHQLGTQPAFLAFIANDGILFRPTAVNGKRWLVSNPPPASNKRSLLHWWPTYADISESGDLGYTTGPWEFKPDISDPKPSAYGNFVTVWKKQLDGSWKFVIDLGISNPQPLNASAVLETPKPRSNKKSSKLEASAMRASLIKRDWQFSTEAQADGWRSAFWSFAIDDVRLLRNDRFPFVGKDAIKDGIGKVKYTWISQPDFGDISRSGDLGYTYGTYELGSDKSEKVEKGNYMRIWRSDNGEWKIVLEVTNPLPEEKKS